MVVLAIDRAPAADLALRYLRMVPIWGLAAAFLVWRSGPMLFASRWSPETIAFTHVITLGILIHAVLGSLLQFLPVVAGARPCRSSPLDRALPLLLDAGLCTLLGGFLAWPALLAPAGSLLAGIMVVYCARALARIRFDGRQRLLRAGISIALLGMMLAAMSGAVLTMGLSGWIPVPVLRLTDAHAAMGLVGCVLLLTGTIGSVVLPMFQGTARPAAGILGVWIAVLVGSLAMAVVLRLLDWISGSNMSVLLALPAMALAAGVLALQWRAPHRRNPALVGFWRMGAISLLVAGAFSIADAFGGSARGALLASAAIVGIALPSLVLGMLLEIVAFLHWLELQTLRASGSRVPGIDVLLPESCKKRLLVLHGLAGLALLGAVAEPNRATTTLLALQLAAAYGMTLYEWIGLRARGHRCALALRQRPGGTA